MKRCAECKENKPLDDFYRGKKRKDGTRGHQHICKECHKAYTAGRMTPEMHRKKHLKYRYDLTLEQYDALVAEREGRCILCNEVGSRLVCDHNHESGKFRDLLCDRCNMLLGLAKDDESLLLRAVEYLRKHNGTT